MISSPPELTFLRISGDGIAVGTGPFAAVAQPPADQPAFYSNDFFLTDPAPWKIPATFEVVRRLDLSPTGTPPEVEWEPLQRGPFQETFNRVFRAFGNGSRLEKLVPVVTERGKLISGDPRKWGQHIADHTRAPVWSYGRWKPSEGFFGATPERLISLTKHGLESMALAGTTTPAAASGFQDDPKQIREHEIVVTGLEEALKSAAMKRGKRELLQLDCLVHFLTPFHGKKPEHLSINDLLHLTHPTPAVGVYPRTSATAALLREVRNALGTPPYFGAPFGVWHENEFHCVVAIRHIAWSGTTVYLPAGCGLIAESALDKEWRELELKRRAVKAMLGCMA